MDGKGVKKNFGISSRNQNYPRLVSFGQGLQIKKEKESENLEKGQNVHIKAPGGKLLTSQRGSEVKVVCN